MLVIKDMKMPKSCIHCPFMDWDWDACMVTPKVAVDIGGEKRAKNCPLVEPVIRPVTRKDCDDCEYQRIKGDEKCVKRSTEDSKPYISFIFRCANRESEE